MIKGALSDSLNLLHLRYKIIRDRKTRFSLWLGILILAIAIIGTSYTGQFIKILAQSTSPGSDAARIFATSYLQSYVRGEMGTLVSVILGLAIASVVIAPFTGTSSTSLISYHHLVSMRASNRHRFTDSLIGQFFASVSLLQLITLTAASSLLTLDGGRVQGVLYAWMSWPILVILSTLFVWIAEYLYRKFGEKIRLVILGIMAGTIAIPILINPQDGKTLFGIGTAYSYLIQHFYTLDMNIKALSVIIIFALFWLFFFIAYKMSQLALAQPEVFAKKKIETKKIRIRKASSFPTIELANLAIIQLWRNLEIRKPLIMATIFGAAVIFFTKEMFSIMSTMILIIPLIVCLSWGSNVFGILGNGFLWLASKPFATRNLLWVFAGIQLFVITALFIAMCLPSLIFGKMGSAEMGGIILAVIGTSIIMTESAMNKSVRFPYPYKAGVRGETILPPAALINYTLRFSLGAGIYGFIIIGLSSAILIQLALVFLAIVWSSVRLKRLNHKFNFDATVRNKIIYTVAND